MAFKMQLPSKNAEKHIYEHYGDMFLGYDENEFVELTDDFFFQMNTLYNENKRLYHLIMGTMIINYFEYYNNSTKYSELIEIIKNDDFDDIVDFLEQNQQYLEDLIEITIEKYEADNEEKYEYLYREMIDDGYEYIYRKCNPFYDMEKIAHEINYPTDDDKKYEQEFYDYYQVLKETLEYPEHIFYCLIDLIQNKWDDDYSGSLIRSFLRTDYYFVKGKEVLKQPINKQDKKFIQEIEQITSLDNAVAIYKQDKNRLSYLIERFCFYQEHLCDDIVLPIHNKEKETQYMKKLTIFQNDK